MFIREEREDDIPKLLEVFQQCKCANEFFYWDAQTDKKTGHIKNIFGAMRANALSVEILTMSSRST
jgi:hypothetical protein